MAPDFELASARLSLRRFSAGDAEPLFSIRGDRVAMRFWDWPGDRSIEETHEIALRIVDEMQAGKALYMSARLADGTFVGLFDLSEIDTQHADIGFMIARRFWGNGYATEGANTLIAHARRLPVKALKARIHAGNTASRRLLHTLGFEAVGCPTPVEVRPGHLVICEHFRLDFAAS